MSPQYDGVDPLLTFSSVMEGVNKKRATLCVDGHHTNCVKTNSNRGTDGKIRLELRVLSEKKKKKKKNIYIVFTR